MTGEQLVAIAQASEPLVELGPPAAERALAQAELTLGIALPQELRAFLLEADGATVALRLDSGDVVPEASPLVWSIAEIVRENTAAPIEHERGGALFFANAGVDGVLFGHRLTGQRITEDVVVWQPIDGDMTTCAASFGDWLRGWLGGEINV
jgi:hypothetical protein